MKIFLDIHNFIYLVILLVNNFKENILASNNEEK